VRLLLDTHVWLWMLSAPERLNATTQSALTDEANELWLSVASAWEVAIKHARGKLPLPDTVSDLVILSGDRFGMQLLPIRLPHALAAAALPPYHNDPFDRLPVAQAQLEAMSLVTADEVVARYGATVWAA
jgi:PIN domain nuclease of toxin-antitoxin system